MTDTVGGALDAVFELLIAELELHGLAIVHVLVLHFTAGRGIHQDLSCSLLEELHLSLTKVKDIFVVVGL